MALTVTNAPSGSNMAYTRLPYVISGSTNAPSTSPQYRYIMDVYNSGSSDLITRVTQPVNPAGVAVFDPSRIIQDSIEYENNWYTSGSAEYAGVNGTLPSNYKFELQFGEQYGTSPSSSISTFPGIVSYFILALPGTVDPNNGSSYNLDESLYLTGSIGVSGSYLPKIYLTNFPDVTSNLSQPDKYLMNWTSPNSYMTLTTWRYDSLTLRYYDKNDVQLGSDIIKPNTTYGILNTIGVGPQNLIDSNIPNYDPVNTAYMSLQGHNTPYYNIGIYRPSGSAHPNQPPSNCDTVLTLASGSTNVTVDNGVNFAFINNLGVYDYYYTTNPVRKITDLERESVDLPQLDYSNASAPYDVNERGQKNYYTDRKDRFIVTTDYITKEVANWLEELFESPRVFVQETGQTYVGDSYVFVSNNTPDVYTGFVPVTVTNKVIQTNNSTSRNKLFQYTIEFEFSNRRAAWIAGPLGQYANVKEQPY